MGLTIPLLTPAAFAAPIVGAGIFVSTVLQSQEEHSGQSLETTTTT